MFLSTKSSRNIHQLLIAFCFVSLLAAVASLYWPGLSGALVLDDLPNLRPLWDLDSGAVTWQQLAFENASGPLGRPLSMLTFIADYYAGAGDVLRFKQTNLAIHLICGCLLFWLCGRLFRVLNLAKPDHRWWFALLATSLWLTAPLLVSSVLYVVQRMAMLATLFSLGGILLYVCGREQLEHRRHFGFILVGMCFLVALPAAVLSKENGAVLPLIILIVEVFWFQFRGTKAIRLYLFTVFSVFLFIPSLVVVVRFVLDPEWLIGGYEFRGYSFGERTYTQTRVLWDYLRQLLIPTGMVMGLFHDDYQLSKGLNSPPTTLIACLGWVLTLGAIVLWRQSRPVRMIGFGLIFFLAGHVIESTILPLEVYFEHRNYLPSAGLFAGVVAALATVMQRIERQRTVALLLVFVPISMAIAAHQRIAVWQSTELMARMAEHTHSSSPRLQSGLVMLYLRDRDLKRSLEHLHEHARLTGGYSAGHAASELMIHCALQSSTQPIVVDSIRSGMRLKIDVFTSERLSDFLELIENNRCPNLDIALYAGMFREWARQIDPNDRSDFASIIRFRMARLLVFVGLREDAYQLLKDNDRLDRSTLEPILLLIRYYLDDDNIVDAEAALNDVGRRDSKVLGYHATIIESYKMYIKERMSTDTTRSGKGREP